MKIGIIVAMDKEFELIRPLLSGAVETDSRHGRVVTGHIASHDVILAKSGIGKVNAAVSTLRMIDDHKPALIINTGVAGGISDEICSRDIFIAESVTYHDAWCGPGSEYGAADGLPVLMKPDSEAYATATSVLQGKSGLLCSGDIFVDSKEAAAKIARHFPQVKAVDMESGAIAQVCALTDTPWLIMRIISDKADSGANAEEYRDFWKEAPEVNATSVKKLLEAL